MVKYRKFGKQGRFGHVHFLNARTKEKAFSIKMNDHIEAFAFSPDGGKIYTHGGWSNQPKLFLVYFTLLYIPKKIQIAFQRAARSSYGT